MYLLELDLGVLKYNSIPKGKVNAALRVGNHLTTATTCISEDSSQTDLRTKLLLQLQTSPETQRCSVTLSFQNNKILGVAVISLPKHTNEISTFCKLIQCLDKKAQLYFKVRLSKTDNVLAEKQTQLKQLQKIMLMGNLSPIKRRQSGIKQKKNLKSLPSFEKDVQEIDNILQTSKSTLKYKVQYSENEVKKLKQEKEVYYQLYQIEKSKNEVAAKFISSLITKLTNQNPQLLNFFIDQPLSPNKRKQSSKKNDNEEILIQLQQANNSLHRQVDEYKKITEQLKSQLFKSSTQNSKKDANNSINLFYPSRSTILSKRQKEITPSKKQTCGPSEVDKLRQWLQVSILQRMELQQSLKQMPKTLSEQQTLDKTKLKSKIDKSFQTLLAKQSFNRMSIILHKREIGKIIDNFLY